MSDAGMFAVIGIIVVFIFTNVVELIHFIEIIEDMKAEVSE